MVVRGAACCRRSQLGRSIDGEPVEPLRGVTQIVGTDDVVPFEDRTRLVPGHLHRDTLGYARAHEVRHGRAAEVVLGTTGAVCRRDSSNALQMCQYSIEESDDHERLRAL